MEGAPTTRAEQLLRGLAAGDQAALKSVLTVTPAEPSTSGIPSGRALPATTSALVHLAALLAGGASTTSLRWAVEFAQRSGAENDDIVAVLVTLAGVVGSARVVVAAPRLALAIGYDIEVEGWDGD